ncbi:MAG TPA: polysaccharide deacetylase family protein [Bacteroidales bacterium]|jgi:hypothetical protein|nr:polysaccharide deacetylase family protein [Bacteroidales bacterium]
MLLIYAPYKTNRLSYVLDFIFNGICSVHYSFTYNKSDFDAYNGAKIAYTNEKQINCAWIYNSGLLFEKDIKNEIPQAVETEWGIAMYKSVSNDSIVPIDVFAAIFWLISRYEEYILPNKDTHGRFDFHDSWAFKNNLLHVPIVNQWARELLSKLQKKYADLTVQPKSYQYIPSFDIDNFYAFKGKSFIRSLLALAHAMVARRFDLVSLRFKYLINHNDPYDTYEYIISICKKNNIEPHFFILTGKTSELDRNLSYNHPLFVDTCKKLKQNSKIGIHLSYHSTEHDNAKYEKQLLENVVSSEIISNRFHFLRFSLPNSYLMLVNSGIKEDYSMAYASIDGYRAGTCTPFYFYDLQNDKTTDLLVFPMPFIDKTFIDSLKLEPTEAILKIKEYIRQIKEYNGVFLSLWHNETLQNNSYWQKWRNVFESTLKEATE